LATTRPQTVDVRTLLIALLEKAGARSDDLSRSFQVKPDWRKDTSEEWYTAKGEVRDSGPTPREWAYLAAYWFASGDGARFFLKGIPLADPILWPDRAVMGTFLRGGFVTAADGRFVVGEAARQRIEPMVAESMPKADAANLTLGMPPRRVRTTSGPQIDPKDRQAHE
jgi:hypothetical protein